MSNRRLRWLWPSQASMDEKYGAPSFGRVPEEVWTVLALPLCQIASALAYARTYEGAFKRVTVFATFLPVLAVSTTLWSACWYLVVHMVRMVFYGAI